MNPAVTLKERVEAILRRSSDTEVQQVPQRRTVLLATIDPAIRIGLTEAFQALPLNTIWLKGVEAVKNMLAKERVAACLCGFWLQDGTYRELVQHIRRKQLKIPVIIVSAPDCPDNCREYVAGMNIGDLDYLCYPYQKSDLESMLRWAIEPLGQQASVILPDLRTGEAA